VGHTPGTAVLTHEIRAVIPGTPAPKGSLRCRRDPNHRLIEDNKKTKPWRDTIARWTRAKWPEGQQADPGQPVGAEITFTIERPKYHYGTGRNAAVVKDSAPRFPWAKPDIDKLVRLVLDALQDAGVLPDDHQVVELAARKAYVGCPVTPDALGHEGAVIRLFPLDASDH
jgi:crossover junction endodeoxyribonuclease RusA